MTRPTKQDNTKRNVTNTKRTQRTTKHSTSNIDKVLGAAKKAGELLAEVESTGQDYCVVFADLADSTKFKIENGLSRGALRAHLHNTLANRAIGNLTIATKWLGDGYLAVVRTEDANQLIEKIFDFQYSLKSEGSQFSEFGKNMKSRVGIHVGAAIIVTQDSDNSVDALGPGLDMASRVLEIAEPGGVYITHTFRNHLTPAHLTTNGFSFSDERVLTSDKYISPTPPKVYEVTKNKLPFSGFRTGGTKDSKLEAAEMQLKEKEAIIERMELVIEEELKRSEDTVGLVGDQFADTVRSLLRLSRGHGAVRTFRRSMLWLPDTDNRLLRIYGNSNVEGPELNLVLKQDHDNNWEGVAGEAFQETRPAFVSGAECRGYRLKDEKRIRLVDEQIRAIYAHPLTRANPDGVLQPLGVLVVDSRHDQDEVDLVPQLRATMNGVGRVLTLLLTAFEPFFGNITEFDGEESN
ncbi:MAG: adenylate/guanylate cyclase domain-containing protein [Desulfobacterales bacterium]|nr:adenylate/guanylate cyclase domain-containing protein [Desulfobacterales bacterium]